VTVAFSVCNGENFSKAKGKSEAIKHLQKGEFIMFTIEEFQDSLCSMKDYVHDFLLAKRPKLSNIRQLLEQLNG
jgi:hypothetical protein